MLIAVVIGIVHHSLAFAAAFGGHNHDTIGRTCAINGCCRSIFQHFNALNIIGIEEVEYALCARIHAVVSTFLLIEFRNRETVNNIKWLVAGIH